MLAVVLSALLLSVSASGSADEGYAFARSLAHAGPRPAASRAERTAHLRVARRFAEAGLRVEYGRFGVPGRGRSRNVIGVHDTQAGCLRIVMAHTDSMPRTDGAVDNASGVGVLVALAPRLRRIGPRCDVWLVATGAEERLYTGRPDHLGASALLRRVRRRGRAGQLRLALSLDEVGRGFAAAAGGAPGAARSEAGRRTGTLGARLRQRQLGSPRVSARGPARGEAGAA